MILFIFDANSKSYINKVETLYNEYIEMYANKEPLEDKANEIISVFDFETIQESKISKATMLYLFNEYSGVMNGIFAMSGLSAQYDLDLEDNAVKSYN